jgi:hypothetical protein
LRLSSNNLTGTIPNQIGRLSQLIWLYLYRNSLTGTIPSEIESLTNLASLDLYDNNLTGEFTCPAFIDDCLISCDPFFDENVTEQECRSL